MKKLNMGNLLFYVIGLIGFLIAVLTFVVIASGIEPTEGSSHVRSGIILFVSFIMCSGVAFSGLMIMALTQISSILTRIEKLLREQIEKTQN